MPDEPTEQEENQEEEQTGPAELSVEILKEWFMESATDAMGQRERYGDDSGAGAALAAIARLASTGGLLAMTAVEEYAKAAKENLEAVKIQDKRSRRFQNFFLVVGLIFAGIAAWGTWKQAEYARIQTDLAMQDHAKR